MFMCHAEVMFLPASAAPISVRGWDTKLALQMISKIRVVLMVLFQLRWDRKRIQIKKSRDPLGQNFKMNLRIFSLSSSCYPLSSSLLDTECSSDSFYPSVLRIQAQSRLKELESYNKKCTIGHVAWMKIATQTQTPETSTKNSTLGSCRLELI